MNDIYIYSNSEFKIIYKKEKFKIGYFTYLNIKEVQNENITILDNNNNSKDLNLFNITNQSGIKTYETDKNSIIKLLYLQPESLTQTFQFEECYVNFHHSYITILIDSIYQTHAFNCCNQNYCLEDKTKIFIFNEKNFLEFDKQNKTFLTKTIKKFKKENDDIEILTAIPFVTKHYTLYKFNIKDNNYCLKNLKEDVDLDLKEYNLPYIIFYLLKCDLDCLINFYNGDKTKLKDYFKQYDEIIRFDDCFYLINNISAQEISFTIKNNKIIDID